MNKLIILSLALLLSWCVTLPPKSVKMKPFLIEKEWEQTSKTWEDTTSNTTTKPDTTKPDAATWSDNSDPWDTWIWAEDPLAGLWQWLSSTPPVSEVNSTWDTLETWTGS